jgi:hypothetical protein
MHKRARPGAVGRTRSTLLRMHYGMDTRQPGRVHLTRLPGLRP